MPVRARFPRWKTLPAQTESKDPELPSLYLDGGCSARLSQAWTHLLPSTRILGKRSEIRDASARLIARGTEPPSLLLRLNAAVAGRPGPVLAHAAVEPLLGTGDPMSAHSVITASNPAGSISGASAVRDAQKRDPADRARPRPASRVRAGLALGGAWQSNGPHDELNERRNDEDHAALEVLESRKQLLDDAFGRITDQTSPARNRLCRIAKK